MRHDPAAPNGMTEFLIVSTVRALGQRGVGRLSMNFAMWGRLFADDVPFTPLERVARRLVILLNPFFQIRSLRRFNAKFDPRVAFPGCWPIAARPTCPGWACSMPPPRVSWRCR